MPLQLYVSHRGNKCIFHASDLSSLFLSHYHFHHNDNVHKEQDFSHYQDLHSTLFLIYKFLKSHLHFFLFHHKTYFEQLKAALILLGNLYYEIYFLFHVLFHYQSNIFHIVFHKHTFQPNRLPVQQVFLLYFYRCYFSPRYLLQLKNAYRAFQLNA